MSDLIDGPCTPHNENKNVSNAARTTTNNKKLTQYATMLSPTTPLTNNKKLTRQSSVSQLQAATLKSDTKRNKTLINDTVDIPQLLSCPPTQSMDKTCDVAYIKKYQSSIDWNDQFNICTCIRRLIYYTPDECIMEIYLLFTLLNNYCNNARSQLARYSIGVYHELFSTESTQLQSAISKVLCDRSIGYECIIILTRQSAGRNGQFIGKEAHDTMVSVIQNINGLKILPALLRLTQDVSNDQKVKLVISEYLELLVTRLPADTVVTNDIGLLCQLCCQLFNDKDTQVRRHTSNIIKLLSERCEQYSWRSTLKQSFVNYDQFIKFNSILKQLKITEIIATDSNSGAMASTPRTTRTQHSIRQRSNSILSMVSPVKSIPLQQTIATTGKKHKLDKHKTVPSSVLASILSGNIPTQTVTLQLNAPIPCELNSTGTGDSDVMTQQLNQVENRRFTRAMTNVVSNKHHRMLSGLIDENDDLIDSNDNDVIDSSDVDIVMNTDESVMVNQSAVSDSTNDEAANVESVDDVVHMDIQPTASSHRLSRNSTVIDVIIQPTVSTTPAELPVPPDTVHVNVSSSSTQSNHHSKSNSIEHDSMKRPGTANKRISKRNRSESEFSVTPQLPVVSLSNIHAQSSFTDILAIMNQIQQYYVEQRRIGSLHSNVLQQYVNNYYLPLQVILTEKMKC